MAGLPNSWWGKKLTTELKVSDELDVEWIQLILEALEMGIDKEDIRQFLKEKKEK